MKKTFFRFLVGTLSFLVLTSCTKTKTENPDQTSTQTTTETLEVEPSKGNIGTATESVPVKILAKEINQSEDDVALYTEKIEEGMAKLGQYVSIEYIESPTGAYKEAIPLAIRTGQIKSDIVYFQGGDEPIASEGLLVDLTIYIENSSNIKNMMQEHNTKRIANYPYLLWLAPVRTLVPVMRSDVFNSLTISTEFLKEPTVDNYYNLFKEMKEKSNLEYAISTDGSMARFDSVFNHAFGITSSFVKVDNKWVSSKTGQSEKNKLEFYSKLYSDGLLDKEYITNAWDTMEQKFYENKVGMLSATAGGVIQIYNDKMTSINGLESELIVLPPAKGESQAFISTDNTKETRGFAILADSEVKEAAFAVLEYMASPEGRVLDKLGVEGIHYNIANEKLVTTEKFPEWWARTWDTLYKLNPPAPYEKEVFSKPMLDSLESITKYYKEDVTALIPDELSTQWDTMNSLYSEYSTDIIRGVRPITDFDEFVVKWNEAGGDELSVYLETVLQK